MEIIKRILRHINIDTGVQEALYFQTSSDLVKRDDGTDVEASLVAVAQKLENLQTTLTTLTTQIQELEENAAARQVILTALQEASQSHDTALSTLNTKTATLEESSTTQQAAIDTLNGSGDGSISKAVTDGIGSVVANAPETFDTLKEIADWLEAHEDDAADLVARIADLEGRHAAWQLESIS